MRGVDVTTPRWRLVALLGDVLVGEVLGVLGLLGGSAEGILVAVSAEAPLESRPSQPSVPDANLESVPP